VIFPDGTTEHPINKSGKRKILVSVWDFGAIHPQSEGSYYLCNDHSTKMHPSLAKAILQLYGESPALDPMAGVGTTLVEAMLLGMDAVGIEYEKKFVDQANKNISHIKKLFANKKLGKRGAGFILITQYSTSIPPEARNLGTYFIMAAMNETEIERFKEVTLHPGFKADNNASKSNKLYF
jgi:hypothetical protein